MKRKVNYDWSFLGQGKGKKKLGGGRRRVGKWMPAKTPEEEFYGDGDPDSKRSWLEVFSR